MNVVSNLPSVRNIVQTPQQDDGTSCSVRMMINKDDTGCSGVLWPVINVELELSSVRGQAQLRLFVLLSKNAPVI
jgi:hypothetical protein